MQAESAAVSRSDSGCYRCKLQQVILYSLHFQVINVSIIEMALPSIPHCRSDAVDAFKVLWLVGPLCLHMEHLHQHDCSCAQMEGQYCLHLFILGVKPGSGMLT